MNLNLAIADILDLWAASRKYVLVPVWLCFRAPDVIKNQRVNELLPIFSSLSNLRITDSSLPLETVRSAMKSSVLSLFHCSRIDFQSRRNAFS